MVVVGLAHASITKLPLLTNTFRSHSRNCNDTVVGGHHPRLNE